VDADRERELRRLERDERRRAQGKSTYFDGWAVLQDPSEMPTMVIRRDELEAQQLSTQETLVIPPAQAEQGDDQANDAPPQGRTQAGHQQSTGRARLRQ